MWWIYGWVAGVDGARLRGKGRVARGKVGVWVEAFLWGNWMDGSGGQVVDGVWSVEMVLSLITAPIM